MSSKGSSSHAGLSGLGSNLAMTGDDYISTSSRGYGVDYAALERRHYGEHHTGYVPREMPADLERRYADPVGHSHQVYLIFLLFWDINMNIVIVCCCFPFCDHLDDVDFF